jgi:predicted phosphoribosyltransferase/pimeloyl-ACP methyl ester carboxylesterase
MGQQRYERTVIVSKDKLEGDLVIPSGAPAIILFAHGSGSSRHSTRNRFVAQLLNDAGFATLLVDLLTLQEKEIDEKTHHLGFDIDLLSRRLFNATHWLVKQAETSKLPIGYFGSSTGASAALISAAKLDDVVKAIVSRGGRPDLTDEDILARIKCPTLLIVGGKDTSMIRINRSAIKQLSNTDSKDLVIIPAASHLFEEEGKMEEVTQVAIEWFECYLIRNGRKFVNRYGNRSQVFSRFREISLGLRFKDRAAAGQILASILSKYNRKGNDITVIGIPRGGVVIADVIARRLNTKLDIVIARKLRAPDNAEQAIGAIMQDGSFYLDECVIESQKISKEYIANEIRREKNEIDRRVKLYRPYTEEYLIKNRTVILADDGAATGSTLIVAARWIKKHLPERLIIAIPVAAESALERLRDEVDIVETMKSPRIFNSVEQFYQRFASVQDSEVLQSLKRHGLL